MTIFSVSFSIFAFLPCVVEAELSTNQSTGILIPAGNVTSSVNEAKARSILSNVFGLDLTRYTIAASSSQETYLNVIEEETVYYILHSNDGVLELSCTFIGANLRKINIFENKGIPQVAKGVGPLLENMDTVESAKTFLDDYYGFTKNPFYNKIVIMLDNVDVNKNYTKISGNVKLEVTNNEVSTVFKWSYTEKGMDAPSKYVALRYENGVLKYFIDNWNLYNVGSTKVSVSEKDAVDIAMKAVSASSWNLGTGNNTVRVSDFKVANAMIWENVFASNIYADKARSEDPLMLYPLRHVWVALDKFYPGNVYGFNVYVWADTGDVCAVNERVSTIDAPADLIATNDDFTVEYLNCEAPVSDTFKSSFLSSIVVITFLSVGLGCVPVLYFLNKRQKIPKRSMLKFWGILLCLLMSSMILLPIVSAYPTRRALIWGSESTGCTSYYGESGRKTQNEITRQQITSNALKNYFEADQYDVDNYQGEDSLKSCILANISNAENYYSKVAVIDFDHGVGRSDYIRDPGVFHYMFEDNVGMIPTVDPDGDDPDNWVNTNMVYDIDIYDETTGDTFFAFINTCASADLTYQDDDPVRGMPYAWTHRMVTSNPDSNEMSDDGYGDPDNGNFCYMGFPWGSASLSQTINGVGPIYANWVEKFFWYALIGDRSINEALDEASQEIYNDDFGDIDLANSFGAIWPMWNTTYYNQWDYDPAPNCKLVVYGNGDIHLYQYYVHEYLSATGYGYGGGENPDNIEGANDGQYTRLYAYTVPPITGQAVINCDLGWVASGHIYLYGYTTVNSYIQVWVSSDNSNWNLQSAGYINQASPDWIDAGTYLGGQFRYIAVVVYYYGNFYVDSLLIIPPI